MDSRALSRVLLLLLLPIGLAACANKIQLREQAGAHYNIGWAYYEKGQYEMALKHYRDAAAKD